MNSVKKSGSDTEQVWALVAGTGRKTISHVVDENPSTVVHWRKVKPDALGYIVFFTITRSGAGSNRRPVAINFGSISTSASVAAGKRIAAKERNGCSGASEMRWRFNWAWGCLGEAQVVVASRWNDDYYSLLANYYTPLCRQDIPVKKRVGD